MIALRGRETAQFLQIEHVADLADEEQRVACQNECVRPSERHAVEPTSFDPREEHTAEISQPGVVDPPPDQRAVVVDAHGDRVGLGEPSLGTLGRASASSEQARGGDYEYQQPDQRNR